MNIEFYIKLILKLFYPKSERIRLEYSILRDVNDLLSENENSLKTSEIFFILIDIIYTGIWFRINLSSFSKFIRWKITDPYFFWGFLFLLLPLIHKIALLGHFILGKGWLKLFNYYPFEVNLNIKWIFLILLLLSLTLFIAGLLYKSRYRNLRYFLFLNFVFVFITEVIYL